MFPASRRALLAARESSPRCALQASQRLLLLPRPYSTQAGDAPAASAAAPYKAADAKVPNLKPPTYASPSTYGSASKSSPNASSRPAPKQPVAKTGSSHNDIPSSYYVAPDISVYPVQAATQPPAAEPSQAIDWSRSYHGIATQPVTVEQFQRLSAPIPVRDVAVKPDGVIYLPEIKYRRKLNEIFGPMGWGLVPRGEPVVGQSIVTREYCLIVNGRFVSQAQGENNFFSTDQLPAAVEGCKSNALMRCCKDLGIGSELWDPNYVAWFKKTHIEEVWVEHVTTGKKKALSFKKGHVLISYPYKKSS